MPAQSSFSSLMGRKEERAEETRGGQGACWCCSSAKADLGDPPQGQGEVKSLRAPQ